MTENAVSQIFVNALCKDIIDAFPEIVENRNKQFLSNFGVELTNI